MKLVFNVATRERRLAVLLDDQVSEIMIERPIQDRIVNNVYLGKVVRVLPGMQAAFVDIGREKNGFLYRDELLSFHLSDEEEEVKKQRNISHYVKVGEQVLVQVTKEEIGDKGARLTGIVSFPGQYIVYMPNGNYVAISKRFTNEAEREAWRNACANLIEKDEGMILRTSSQYEQVETIEKELSFFRTFWQQLIMKVKDRSAPTLIYQSSSIIERAVRDYPHHLLDEVIVDEAADYELIKKLLQPYDLQHIVTLYYGKENIFSAYRIEKEVERALRRQIWLKNGASITIDETEALTVIDVNTGKFTGKTDLQDTIFRTNREAVKEIVKQMKVRNLGGIIIIDFIDMRDETAREQLLHVLKKELATDRTKTNVVGFTGLGLVELTRKRVQQSIQASISKQCVSCGGKGVVLANEAQAFKIEREIWEYRHQEIEAVVLELPSHIQPVFSGQDGSHLKRLEEAVGFRIFVYPNKYMKEETYAIRYAGSLEEAVSQLERLKLLRK